MLKSAKKELLKIYFKILDYTHNNWGIPVVFNDSISIKYIKNYLPSNPVILECGAFDGKDSMKLQKKLKGIVHSIEANPACFNLLKNSTKKNKHIYIYNIGLSEQTEKKFLNVSSGASESASSFLNPNEFMHEKVLFNSKIEVDCYSLKDFVLTHKVDNINFLYLDMQGLEYYVLKGSMEYVKKINVIYLEVCFIQTYDGEILHEKIEKLLTESGFVLNKITTPLGAKHGNALYINKNIL